MTATAFARPHLHRLESREVPAVFAASSTGQLPAYLLDQNGGVVRQVNGAFEGAWTGEVRSASADVTGDGVFDLILSAGGGGGPRVQVYDGASGALFRDFFAYDPGFRGGLYVGVGDVNGDGLAEVITGAGLGGGPHVRVFDAGSLTEVGAFFASDPGYLGGVRVSAGDVNADGKAEIAVGMGYGGSSVAVFTAGASVGGATAFSLYDTEGGFDGKGGVFVTVADVTGDGRGDLIYSVGAGAPVFRVSKAEPDNSPTRFTNYFGFRIPEVAEFTGGLRVTARDLDGDGRSDLIFALGQGFEPDLLTELLYGPGVGGDTQLRLLNAGSILSGGPFGYLATPGLYPGHVGIYIG